jgi:Squalene epoxidase
MLSMVVPCCTRQVPQQLKAAFLQAVDEGRIRSMQNKSMPAAPLHRPGALLLGESWQTQPLLPFPKRHYAARQEILRAPLTRAPGTRKGSISAQC